MKKMNRLPHEQVSDIPTAPEADGLPATDQDVEAHRYKSGPDFLPGQPGTGGDSLRRPLTGGEVDGDDTDDVEGHTIGHTRGERLLPGLPGTGGDEVATIEDGLETHRKG